MIIAISNPNRRPPMRRRAAQKNSRTLQFAGFAHSGTLLEKSTPREVAPIAGSVLIWLRLWRNQSAGLVARCLLCVYFVIFCTGNPVFACRIIHIAKSQPMPFLEDILKASSSKRINDYFPRIDEGIECRLIDDCVGVRTLNHSAKVFGSETILCDFGRLAVWRSNLARILGSLPERPSSLEKQNQWRESFRYSEK